MDSCTTLRIRTTFNKIDDYNRGYFNKCDKIVNIIEKSAGYKPYSNDMFLVKMPKNAKNDNSITKFINVECSILIKVKYYNFVLNNKKNVGIKLILLEICE